MSDVQWHQEAVDQLIEISRRDQRQARRRRDAVFQYAREGRGDIKRLTGQPGELRLRVGDWRVLLRTGEGIRGALVVRVALRRDAYDD